MTIIEQLQRLGFNQYEAQAYIALLQHNPLSGYELAKLSGVPRPNIYSVLQKLEERGAVVRVDSAEGARYSPVASDELIQRLQANFQENLEVARQALDNICTVPEQEYIWNANGYSVLLNYARSFIEEAEKQLFLAVWPQEAALLSEPLGRAEARGVEITTLCLAGCSQNCGNCRGQVHRYPVAPERDHRWLLLIPDETEVLAGEIGPGEEALAVRTRQRMLVDLAGWYIRQSIALSAILLSLDDHQGAGLDPGTLAILEELRGTDSSANWLEQMRGLLRMKNSTSPAQVTPDSTTL